MEIVKFTNFNELRSSKESKLKTSLFNEIGEFKAFNAKKRDKTSYFNVLRISRKLRHLRHKHGKTSYINENCEIY